MGRVSYYMGRRIDPTRNKPWWEKVRNFYWNPWDGVYGGDASNPSVGMLWGSGQVGYRRKPLADMLAFSEVNEF